MDDIDSELLLLAGEESSDDEPPANANRQSSSPDRKPAGKATSKKAGGRAASRRRDESEEEGEASSTPSSPTSQRSAPMDESDSESDASPTFDDEAGRYPLEGKFMNAADKASIMAMPEIKREELLAERAQEVERERQNRALRQLLSAREADAKKQDKKRKAATADLEENSRKTSRQRTKLGGGKVGEASTGIDSLKRARAEKTDRQRRRDEDKERHKGKQYDDYSDREADRESDVEWDDPKAKKKSNSPEYRDAQPAELVDIERLRVGRTRFAQVCFYPGFDEAIAGCFARISVGTDSQNKHQNLYRVGLIKGFIEDKNRPYAIITENGKTLVTTQYLRATHGKSEKTWPFITCSDSRITEGEWNRYKQQCLVDGVPLPTKPRCIAKITDINNLINRSWTEAELQEKLMRSGALANKYSSIERNRLANLLQEARANGDTEREELIREELNKLDGPKLAFNTHLQPSPKKPNSETSTMSQQDRIALLNRQNRKKNIEEVRQAQIAERKKARAIEAAIARGETVVEDHSRRVKTVAKVNHDVSESFGSKKATDSGVGTPARETNEKKQSEAASTKELIAKLHAAKAEQGGIPTISKPLVDDDIIGAIDLEIDVDLGL